MSENTPIPTGARDNKSTAGMMNKSVRPAGIITGDGSWSLESNRMGLDYGRRSCGNKN